MLGAELRRRLRRRSRGRRTR